MLLATRNRAAELRTTLEALCRVRRESVRVEIVVINNGSTDATDVTVRDFQSRLPLRLVREPEPGKSAALNRALDSVELGELVLFTDDDITPDPSWFEQIIAVSRRWPQHSIFGGRIDPQWPDGMQPAEWQLPSEVQEFAFARHVIRDDEGEYPPKKEPFGANYWVRRELLTEARFLRGVGPQPKGRKVGGETQFLRQLRRRGFTPVFAPSVQVFHRLEPEALTQRYVYRRAVQVGRGVVYTRGVPEEELLSERRIEWLARRAVAIARNAFRLSVAAVSLNEARRIRGIAIHLIFISTDLEALRFARQSAARGAAARGAAAEGITSATPAPTRSSAVRARLETGESA